MSAPVFLAEPSELSGFGVGETYHLLGGEGRHAGVVQRRAVGERVDVVDGLGVRLETTVAAAEPGGLALLVVARVVEPRPSPSLILVQALAKGDRDELAIEAATEVGVDAVLPWQADRSVVIWRGERAAKSRARWLATVRAAAKQSRRAWVPAVGITVDSKGLVQRVAASIAGGGTVLVLHEDAAVAIAQVELPVAAPGDDEGRIRQSEPHEILVVVGPEGGIGERELASLTEAGAQAVRLGPHVLRTSTAGPVAIALLAERLGRWA